MSTLLTDWGDNLSRLLYFYMYVDIVLHRLRSDQSQTNEEI